MSGSASEERLRMWRKHFLPTLAALLGIMVAMPSLVESKVEKITLSDMIKKSGLIVVGITESLTPLSAEGTNASQAYGSIVEARVRISYIIKGHSSTETVLVRYNAKVSPRPEFIVGQESLMFLTCDTTCMVVQKYAGNIDIIDGWLKDIYMMGEEEKQPVQSFIEKIRKLNDAK